jgi:hypothetical protein
MKLETAHRLLFDIILGEIAIIACVLSANTYIWMITHDLYSLIPFIMFQYLSIVNCGVTISFIVWFVIGMILGDAYYECKILGMPV